MADGEGAHLNEKGGWKQTPGKVSDYQGNFVDPLWVGSNSLGQSECVEGVYQAVNSLGPPNHSLATDWSSFTSRQPADVQLSEHRASTATR